MDDYESIVSKGIEVACYTTSILQQSSCQKNLSERNRIQLKKLLRNADR